MYAGANLRFDGAVPPEISDENVVGRDQVQARAAGLDADLYMCMYVCFYVCVCVCVCVCIYCMFVGK